LSLKYEKEIRPLTTELLRAIDPGALFDREDLAELFAEGNNPLNTDGTYLSQHNPARNGDNSNFIAAALHRIFLGTIPSARDLPDIVQAAKELVDKYAVHPPALPRLLSALLQGKTQHFDLLKLLCLGAHDPGRPLPLYALAFRLCIGDVDPTQFTAAIIVDGRTHAVTPSNFDEIAFESVGDKHLYELPHFPSLRKTSDRTFYRHRSWAHPFVRLVGHALQKRKDGECHISRVEMDYQNLRQIVRCNIEGNEDRIEDLRQKFLNARDTKPPSPESRDYENACFAFHLPLKNREWDLPMQAEWEQALVLTIGSKEDHT